MKVVPTKLDGVVILETAVYEDVRGFFMELSNSQVFERFNLPTEFKQVNHSRSKAGVLRGLHYQNEPAQGKLITAISGKVFDVAVDIRADSPSFGQHVAVELSAQSGRSLWIPPGFAHGFCCIDPQGSDLVYMVTTRYNRNGEGGILWNDPDLNIQWPVSEPILSERDRKLPRFKQFRASLDRQ